MSTLARSISALGPARLLLRLDAVHGSGLTPREIEWTETKFRCAPADLSEGHLAQIFGLNPRLVCFDLPSAAFGTGSARVGAGGLQRGPRKMEGFVFPRDEQGRKDDSNGPIARITWATEGEKFRDVDPNDRREFERL